MTELNGRQALGLLTLSSLNYQISYLPLLMRTLRPRSKDRTLSQIRFSWSQWGCVRDTL